MRFIVILLFASLIACTKVLPPRAGSGSPGAPCHDIPVLTTSGETRRLGDYLGEATLLHFWATWCVTCREEMSSLGRVARELPSLRVIAIAVEDDPVAVAEFIETAELPYTVVLDGGTARARFNIRSLPHTVLLDQSGARMSLLDPESGETVAAVTSPRYWGSTTAIERLRQSIR